MATPPGNGKVQGNNYGSYRPRAFKESFRNLLPQSQQSHGFFKANLQQVKVGKSREALFKQARLFQTRTSCCHVCVGNQPETLGTSKWHHDCRQHKHSSGHVASSPHSLGPLQPGISCHLPLSRTQMLPPPLLWLERRWLSSKCFPQKQGYEFREAARGRKVNLFTSNIGSAFQSLENKPTILK